MYNQSRVATLLSASGIRSEEDLTRGVDFHVNDRRTKQASTTTSIPGGSKK